jgi:hypothetical protein
MASGYVREKGLATNRLYDALEITRRGAIALFSAS